MVNDLTADMLTRLQNAVMRKREDVEVLKNKLNIAVLEVLKQEGMITDFEIGDRTVTVSLVYEDKEPLVSHFTKVSKLGQRIYWSAEEIKPMMNGRGIYILSTSQGVMTGSQAKSKGVGGELICEIW
jgi:small subunit ribosomal protein S8